MHALSAAGRAAALACVTLLIAACGAPPVSREVLERTVAERVAEGTGERPQKVDCPEPLPAEEAASVTCSYVHGDEDHRATVRVSRIDGTTVVLDVDFEPS